MSKISVITTVYNGEPYWERVSSGILRQTHSNFEWVIVDDGSTDRTRECLNQLAQKDRRVRVFTPGRLGRARALNYAVEKARGEYIAQQDFDDFSYPSRLEKQAALLDTDAGVGVVGSYYILVDENRGEKYVRMPPTSHEQIVRAMSKSIPFAHTVVMFRKEAWRQVGGYPIFDDIEDLHLWISMGAKGWRFANLPDVLGEHRVHSSSYWHRSYDYKRRQRLLAKAQWRAIRELGQPIWQGVYPIGRAVYPLMPNGLKRFVRRFVAKSGERDLRGCQR